MGVYYLAWCIAGLLIASVLYLAGAINFWAAFGLYCAIIVVAALLVAVSRSEIPPAPTPIDMMKHRF